MHDIMLQNPSGWTSAWLYCRDIVIEGISVWARVRGNGDGLDFDGCKNVRVSNCSLIPVMTQFASKLQVKIILVRILLLQIVNFQVVGLGFE